MGASHGNYSHERSRGQEVRNGTKRAGPQPLFCLQCECIKEHGDGGIPFASFMRSGQPGIGGFIAVTWPSARGDGCPGSDSFYSAHSLTQEREPSPGWESIIIPYMYRMFLLLMKYFHIQCLTAASQQASR